MEPYQTAIIPDAVTFGLYQGGEAVNVYVLVYPEWEAGFSAGNVIEVSLISNGIDRPRFNGLIVENDGKSPTIPEGTPYALKLLVRRI